MEKKRIFARYAIAGLRVYQAWSAFSPPRCRYGPSCSAYAIGAIETHGLTKGFWLTLRRLLRCHPFHTGGWDPVPVPPTTLRSL